MPPSLELFDPATVEHLPDAGRRFLLHAIAPGTPLVRSATLRMSGQMHLQPGGPAFAMKAEQWLAPPRGFIWRARVSRGRLRISGSDRYVDSEGAMNWKLFGIVPVARAFGPEVTRSAAGRLAGESVFVPAALLPGNGAEWNAVDDAAARIVLPVGDERVQFTLHVHGDGRLERVRIKRWREGEKERPAGYASFDLDGFADERTFDGYTIPTRFRAGWNLDSPEGFPFFFPVIEHVAYG